MLNVSVGVARRKGRSSLVWALAKGWRLNYVVPALFASLIALACSPAAFVAPQAMSAMVVRSPTSAGLALLWALIIVATLPEPVEEFTSVLTRRRRYLGQLRVVVLVVVTIAVGGLISSLALVAVPLLALTGEALWISALLGPRYAWVLPMSHALGAATLGANPFGQLAPWAWFMAGRPSALGLTASAAIFVSGLLLTANHRRS